MIDPAGSDDNAALAQLPSFGKEKRSEESGKQGTIQKPSSERYECRNRCLERSQAMS
jgi:hypothetical protein